MNNVATIAVVYLGIAAATTALSQITIQPPNDNGVASLAIPGGAPVAVFRGGSLTNLQLVADNPEQSGFWAWPPPLYPFLRFATRAGENYAIQVSLPVSPQLGIPFYICEPPWIKGGPFTFTLNFLPYPIGLLDENLVTIQVVSLERQSA